MGRKDLEGELLEKTKEKVAQPPKYTCLIHNDNYTTQEFVVYVLKTVFKLKTEEAVKKMMDVHKKGRGAVGSYPHDIARTKASQVESMARENEFPLKCTVELL